MRTLPGSLFFPGIKQFKRAWWGREDQLRQLGIDVNNSRSAYEKWRATGGSADEYIDRVIARASLWVRPNNLKEKLSVGQLDDVPALFAVRSQRDAKDRDVVETARKTGRLHPQANQGVAYRALFLPELEAEETAVSMVFGGVVSTRTDHPREPRESSPDEAKPGWILLTNVRVLWHRTSDVIPGLPPATYVTDWREYKEDSGWIYLDSVTDVSSSGIDDDQRCLRVATLKWYGDYGAAALCLFVMSKGALASFEEQISSQLQRLSSTSPDHRSQASGG
jgi:hypothetical protein